MCAIELHPTNIWIDNFFSLGQLSNSDSHYEKCLPLCLKKNVEDFYCGTDTNLQIPLIDNPVQSKFHKTGWKVMMKLKLLWLYWKLKNWTTICYLDVKTTYKTWCRKFIRNHGALEQQLHLEMDSNHTGLSVSVKLSSEADLLNVRISVPSSFDYLHHHYCLKPRRQRHRQPDRQPDRQLNR